MDIGVYAFTGEGMARVYENEKWMVGLKNWKPANDIAGIDCLERHHLTDELFVLLSGRCWLLSAVEKEGVLDFAVTEMVPMQVYNIPATLWHNTVTQKDTKLVLIEDANTGAGNTDVLPLSASQIAEIEELVGRCGV